MQEIRRIWKITKILKKLLEYLEIGTAFYYIQRSQKIMHTVRHWNNSKASIWFLILKHINKFLKKISLKKILKYQINPCNIDKWDFRSTIYQNVPPRVIHIISQRATIWCLELQKIENIWEKLKGSENNTKVFQKPCNAEEPVLLSTNSKVVRLYLL